MSHLTPSYAWDYWVGAQTPEEFVEVSIEMGYKTVKDAVDAYVLECPSLFWYLDELIPEELGDRLYEVILDDYKQRGAVPPIPWEVP